MPAYCHFNSVKWLLVAYGYFAFSFIMFSQNYQIEKIESRLEFPIMQKLFAFYVDYILQSSRHNIYMSFNVAFFCYKISIYRYVYWE